MSGPDGMVVIALLSVFLSAMLATRLAIAYGLRRQLIDLPGGRRLHRQPTVRGAGVGAVVVLLLGLLVTSQLRPEDSIRLMTLVTALGMVAAVGWWDDHRPLAARWRLLVHLGAVVLLLSPLMGAASWLVWLSFLVALIWLINAYNFIDGSDAFAAGHAVWIAGCSAVAGALQGAALVSVVAALVSLCSAGFLYFNWPPARAFLGDVASGTLGLALGAVILLSWERASLDPLLPMLLISGVVLDATLTLISRMVSGRRWYAAHRSHLYQWLLRSGWAPARVLSVYLGWSMLAGLGIWLVPAVASYRLLIAGAMLAIGSILWVWARQRILRRTRQGLRQ